MPRTTISATAVQATTPSTRVSLSSSFCSGDRVRFTAVSIVAMRPISVCIPVAVTTAVAVPRVTEVFWNSMFVRSPRAISGPVRTSAPLLIGALSPVSAASWVSSVADTMIRASAGTTSPPSSRITSPGTISSAGINSSWPSRSTRVCGTWSLASASTLARALSSCRAPRTTLSSTSAATRTAVETSRMSRLATATATSMMFIGSRSCPSAITQTEGGFSLVSVFGPTSRRRWAATRWVRPCRGIGAELRDDLLGAAQVRRHRFLADGTRDGDRRSRGDAAVGRDAHRVANPSVWTEIRVPPTPARIEDSCSSDPMTAVLPSSAIPARRRRPDLPRGRMNQPGCAGSGAVAVVHCAPVRARNASTAASTVGKKCSGSICRARP
jgi:hypothetical protein